MHELWWTAFGFVLGFLAMFNIGLWHGRRTLRSWFAKPEWPRRRR